MSVRALVIGITGGTLDVLKNWAKIGWMPNLESLLERSAYGHFRANLPPVSLVEWSVLMTGKGPGHTGLANSMVKIPGTYFMERARLFMSGVEPFWHGLDRSNYRTALINLPFLDESYPVNGVVVGPKGVFSHRGRNIPDVDRVLARINAKLNRHPFRRSRSGFKSVFGPPFDLLDDSILSTIQQGIVMRDLLGSRHWDLSIVNFSGLDRVLSHHFNEVELIQKRGPKTPLEEDVLTYFKVLDDAIGQAVQTLEKKGLLIILSGHEFGALDKRVNINHFLMEQGLLTFRNGRQGISTLSRYVSPFIRRLGLTRSHLRTFSGTIVSEGFIDSLALPFSEDLSMIDWKNTRAFSLGSHSIHLNVKGREIHGTVSDGVEYRGLGNEIIECLRRIRDPETGQPVIFDIKWREELYDGERLQDLPDLVINDWNPRYDLPDYDGIRHQNSVFSTSFTRTGSTRREGFSLVMGPNLPSGEMKGPPFSLSHVAPTVLNFLGFEPGNGMEMHPFTNTEFSD